MGDLARMRYVYYEGNGSTGREALGKRSRAFASVAATSMVKSRADVAIWYRTSSLERK